MTHTSWADYPHLPDPPPLQRHRNPPHDHTGGYAWFELPENGWGALVAWCAGPERVASCPLLPTRPVYETHWTRRRVTRREVPRSADDQAGIDADANAYLGDAGIPPRPGSRSWLLRLPPGQTQVTFWAAIGQAERAAPDAAPSSLRPFFEATLRELYTADGQGGLTRS